MPEISTDQIKRLPVSYVIASLTVFWLAALELTAWKPRIGLWVTLALIVMAIFWAGQWKAYHRERWMIVAAVAMFMFSSLAALAFIERPAWQQVLIFISGFVLLLFLRYSRQSAYSAAESRVVSFLTMLSLFFGWVGILSSGVFFSVSWWVLGLLGGLLAMTGAMVVWWESNIPYQVFRRLLLPIFILGVELTVALWALPTSIVVRAITATTIMILFLQMCRHLWLQSWAKDRGRRYLLISAVVILAMFLTARWR